MAKSTTNSAQVFLEKLSLYQSANSSNQAVKDNFIVRNIEFELIIDELKRKKVNDPLQQELILGRRGSGKSTLLKRIQIEIEEDEKLIKKYIPINLPEEQANIYRLFDLYIEIIKEVEIKLEVSIELPEFKDDTNQNEYTREIYNSLHLALKKSKKKAVVLLDNFDRILDNFTEDAQLLREMLINFNDIKIIGGSTRMDEHFWQYDKPFYEFFRVHNLNPLTTEEIHELLNHWSDSLEIPEIRDFVQRSPEKIENIRILTDGLPRTIQIFVQVLLKREGEDLAGYEYLKNVMDNATPLFQERLNNLPPPLRKTVAEMAFIWESASTKEISEKCKMPSKLVSANLKTLVKKGLVDQIKTNTKNHLYRLSERFFNMWLIVTQGNPDQKRKARWLSIFLENWYGKEEFRGRLKEYIKSLEKGSVHCDKAIILSKAFSQSRYTSIKERDKIISQTRNLNSNLGESQFSELPQLSKTILENVQFYIDSNKYEVALQEVLKIENEEDGLKECLLGIVYHAKGDVLLAEEYLLNSIEKGESKAMLELGYLHHEKSTFEKAEKYYLMAIENGAQNTWHNLGILYSDSGKTLKAKESYLKSVDLGDVGSMNNLAKIYFEEGQFENSIELVKLAHENGRKMILFYWSYVCYNNNLVDYKEECFQWIYDQKINEIEDLGEIDFANLTIILVKIWNGRFENLDKDIASFIHALNKESQYGKDLIFELLVQKQYQLALKLFDNKKELKVRFKISYLALKTFQDDISEREKLRTPPEIQETLNDYISEVREAQEFYGYSTT